MLDLEIKRDLKVFVKSGDVVIVSYAKYLSINELINESFKETKVSITKNGKSDKAIIHSCHCPLHLEIEF